MDGDIGDIGDIGAIGDIGDLGDVAMGDLGGETPGTDAASAGGDAIGGGIGNDPGIVGDASGSISFDDIMSLISKSLPIIGLMTGNPALGILGAGLGMAQGNVPGTIGSMGGMAAGLPGAIGGMAIGNSLGGIPGMSASDVSAANAAGADPGNAAGSGVMGGLDSGLLGLGSLWQWNQNRKDLGGLAGTLQGMYGQDSPYAQALRSKLQAQDASRGRRSSGLQGRETALQAELARAMSGQAGTLSQIYGQRNTNNQQMLANMMGLYKMMGGQQGVSKNFRSLMDMFRGDGVGSSMGSSFDGRAGGDIAPNWGDGGGMDFGGNGSWDIGGGGFDFGSGADFGNQDLGAFF